MVIKTPSSFIEEQLRELGGITNSSGRWVQNQDEVADSFIEFYQELFHSSNLVVGVEDLDPLPCIVSDEMNSKLSQEFMEWEVQAALK